MGKSSPLHLDGRVDEDWQRVQDVFRANHEGGWEKEGSAFAVFHKGKLVVDLWGGYADKASGRLWKEDTMTCAYSSTKAVSALAVEMLVDRGLLDYDAPVTQYWPEFGKNGKDALTAGLAVIDEKRQITADMLGPEGKNWEMLASIFEDQEPNWNLGETHGYHALTFGWLLDVLVRKVDPKHRSLGVFVKEEITQPHGLFEMTLAKARLTGQRTLFAEIGKNPAFLGIGKTLFTNDPDHLALEMGAANGVGTARELARIFAVYNQGLLVEKGGEAWKKVLVPPAALTPDLILPKPIDWSYGYMFATNDMGSLELGHGGYGGQNVKCVPELDLSFAYLTNGLTPDMGDDAHNFGALRKAVYQSLQALQGSQ